MNHQPTHSTGNAITCPPCGPTAGRQAGVTMVEVMIAMVIGLLLSLIAGTVFLGGRQSFRLQDNFAHLQEGGRAVLEDVSREIRRAGSYGCFRWKDGVAGPGALVNAKLPNSAAGLYPIPMNGTVAAFDKNYDVRGGPVTGLTLPSGSGITVAAGTDYIQVMYGQPIANVANNALAASATGTVPVALNHGVQTAVGQPLLISDCDAMTLFRVDNAGNSVTTLNHLPPTNNTQNGTNRHTQGSTVMNFQVTAFFVGSDASGVKSLYRWERSSNSMPLPLVANVEDMRVIFGVDAGGGIPANVNTWSDGASVTAWDRVITVAMHVVMRSNDTGLSATPISFTWDAAKKIFVQGTSGSDYYVRRPYTINAVIRSRAPIFS